MKLETKRLMLRPWQESDSKDLYNYAKDSRVGPICGWQPHSSEEESLQVIKNVLAVDETYAIVYKENCEVIGSISLFAPSSANIQSLKEDELELGFWIGVPFWGKGIVPEASEVLLRHAFEDLGCMTVWCGCYDGNEQSKRVQEKCGFSYEHTEADVPVPLLGETRTEHFTKLTKQDWEARNR